MSVSYTCCRIEDADDFPDGNYELLFDDHKVLLKKHRDEPKLVQRFLEEAKIGGQIQHPGVVPVYELGRFADGRPFFTMKLVKGNTLAKLLEQGAGQLEGVDRSVEQRPSPGPSARSIEAQLSHLDAALEQIRSLVD